MHRIGGREQLGPSASNHSESSVEGSIEQILKDPPFTRPDIAHSGTGATQYLKQANGPYPTDF